MSHNGAPEGNKYWTLRERHGRKPKYKSAQQLWERAVEYFEWVEENPLQEQKAFCNKDGVEKTELNKMRAMTLRGLYLFLDIDRNTWNGYRERNKSFTEVVERVEDIIYEQKFTGAAAGLLNASIIARDLGLKEQVAGTITGAVVSIDSNTDPQAAADAYLEFLKIGVQSQES